MTGSITAPKPFTHRIYIDFSGDDGDPSKGNASKVISSAWLLSSVGDVDYNEKIVLKIKKIIGCKPRDELKYRSIRRHPKKREALLALRELKIKLVILVVIKNRLKETDLKDPHTKRVVDLIHYVPITRFISCGALPPYPEAWFQVVFDEISWAGCQEEIKKYYLSDKKIIWDPKTDPHSLIFAKSGAVLLLQLADVFAGIMREYIEGIAPEEFPNCRLCFVKKRRDCSYRRKGVLVGKQMLIKTVLPFLISNHGKEKLDNGIMIRPPEEQNRFIFIDCLS